MAPRRPALAPSLTARAARALQEPGEAGDGEAGEAAKPQDHEARGSRRDSGREREADKGRDKERDERPGTEDKEREQLIHELGELTRNLTMTDAMK